MAAKSESSGFTLMEMAVVLAVISILVFSIFKGQALIHQGKIRKAVQQVVDIRTAANLFFREQNRLPGDGQCNLVIPLPNPITSGCAAGRDGWIGKTTVNESNNFYPELVQYGYVPGKQDEYKRNNPLGGQIWVAYEGTVLKDNLIYLSGLGNDDMTELDKELDDGNLNSGRAWKIGDYWGIRM